MARQEFNRKSAIYGPTGWFQASWARLFRWTCDLDIVGRVGFAIRSGRSQREVVAFALILVGLMPGIQSNYAGEVAGTEVIDGYAVLVGNDIEAAVSAKLLQSLGE